MVFSPNLKQQQAIIGLQILVSVPFQIAFLKLAPEFFDLPAAISGAVEDRLTFGFQWLVFPGLILLAMIAAIAGTRPTSIDVIDGNDQAEKLAVQVRIQRNTLEQLVVLVIAIMALSTLLPPTELVLLPALAILFCIARVLYWVGYSINPVFRTFGFVATFYPNIYALGLATYILIG
jgi:uncharacterized membrane protein YecN with MAPEG domain